MYILIMYILHSVTRQLQMNELIFLMRETRDHKLIFPYRVYTVLKKVITEPLLLLSQNLSIISCCCNNCTCTIKFQLIASVILTRQGRMLILSSDCLFKSLSRTH